MKSDWLQMRRYPPKGTKQLMLQLTQKTPSLKLLSYMESQSFFVNVQHEFYMM